ncbi:helix-turn-helix domain-containing protein, partial [Cobetia sp. LC6]|uniref:helix-turn-helix domain-containing protein n=1 Tax=Cobetia sp. LC6 TaxID=3050947 RepID=UPI002553E401
MSYLELSITDRATNQVCLSQGLSLRAITRCLSRFPSTISREIRRNSEPGNDYQAERAQASR